MIKNAGEHARRLEKDHSLQWSQIKRTVFYGWLILRKPEGPAGTDTVVLVCAPPEAMPLAMT